MFRPYPFPLDGICDSERVVYSGDLVRQDEEGYLYFVGRSDNQIKSAGFRISPTEVGEVLCRSNDVHAAAVVGLTDDVLGQQIKAYVVPVEDSRQDEAQLVAFCAENLPRHMVPKQIEFLDTLPVTASGKTDYVTLRDRGLSAQSSETPAAAATSTLE